MTYWKTVGSATSRVINAIIVGNPDETVCARVGRWQEAGRLKGRVGAAVLDFLFSAGHCRRSRERFLIRYPEFK